MPKPAPLTKKNAVPGSKTGRPVKALPHPFGRPRALRVALGVPDSPTTPGAVDDRLFQGEFPADQRLGALVEKRVALAAAALAARKVSPRRHGSDGEHREHQQLRLP